MFDRRLTYNKTLFMENNQTTEAELWAYISKTTDEVTVKKVEQWMRSSDFDKKLFAKIESIYTITGKNSYNNTQVEPAKRRFFTTVESKKSKPYHWKNIFKYAAVLAIIVVASEYYQFTINNKQLLVQTTYGENKQINLSDGSVVWLNASSKLTYSPKSPRKIYLEGEAFFEVEKDKEHPFIVTTQDGIQVKVLGTSFNVKAYAENIYSETILFTGKVEITSDNYFKNKILLLPKDKITFFRNSKKIIKSKVELTENSISWKEGMIQFKNKSFKEIANDLNIQYNIKIHFENERLSQSKFTGSFKKSTPIEEILEILQVSKHFKFEKSDNNVWIIK